MSDWGALIVLVFGLWLVTERLDRIGKVLDAILTELREIRSKRA